MDYLFLDVVKMSHKSRRFLHALYKAAKRSGVDCEMSTSYKPCKALVIFGLGGKERFPVGMAHLKAGKSLLSFDIGYWDRQISGRKYRFSLNGFHPSQVMEAKRPEPDRFNGSGLCVRDIDIKSDGPIMLVGNAPKSIAVGANGWTAKKSKEIRKMFPGRKIIYRPKPKRPVEGGVSYDGTSVEPIEQALEKVSLVVCRHSNVAVDACIMGVPVVCDDGAAACIYPQELKDYKNQPSLETRTEFLHRLAYWQWGANEVEQFWEWFFDAFPAHDFR